MHTFATPTPITTVLTIPAGHIELHASDRADTVVEVQPANPTLRRDVKAAAHTTVDHTDGILRNHTQPASNQYLGPTGSLRVTVQLPAGSRVEATTASAELRTTGRLGEVVFDGAYRHIDIDHAATLRLTAVDGDVTVGHLDGPAEITTARGDIHIGHATRGTVVLRTQAGTITVAAAPGVSASLDAGTTSGRITNTLHNTDGAQLDIHATTNHGDIVARSL